MNNTFVARQPILNRKGHTLGYELLFRDGENNAYPAHIESNRATYRLIVENFLSMGTNPLIKHSRCFINFPYESLLRELPLMLPKHKVVVEILETCPPTDELYQAVKKLHQHGYLIALDDFVFTPEWQRFLNYVHIIKLDLQMMGIEAACAFVKECHRNNNKQRFLAEKVENKQEFLIAKQAGFQFFQGYYFSKPEILRSKYATPEYTIALRLFQEVCLPDVDFIRVEQIITSDVALSYKLLSFVNGMLPKGGVEIASFRQALIYLGQDRLILFVSLTVASYVSSNKPRELYNLSIQRAQFCQLMSNYHPFKAQKEQAFMIGLFSMLDALLDASLEGLLEALPLTDVVKQALLQRKGPYGVLLALEECFEQADWVGIDLCCTQLGLSIPDVHHELEQAQRWSQAMRQHLQH